MDANPDRSGRKRVAESRGTSVECGTKPDESGQARGAIGIPMYRDALPRGPLGAPRDRDLQRPALPASPFLKLSKNDRSASSASAQQEHPWKIRSILFDFVRFYKLDTNCPNAAFRSETRYLVCYKLENGTSAGGIFVSR